MMQRVARVSQRQLSYLFDRSRLQKSPAQTPYRRKLVPIRHGRPRPRRCAGGGIRGVINSVGRSGSLFVTRAAHFSVTRM